MDITPKSEAPRQFKWFLLLGFVFECLLLPLPLFETQDSWLGIKTVNFVIISHYLPWTVARMLFPTAEVVGIVLICLVMSLVWACLFYLARAFVRFLFITFRISRRKKILIACGCFFTCVVFLIWPIIEDFQNHPTPFKLSPGAKTLVNNNTVFALALYQNQRQQPGNLFFSPYSISSGMAMVYAGARGQTESEIAQTLHFSLPQSALHPAFSELMLRANNLQHWGHISLLSANSLWCQKDYPLKDAFKDLARDDYQAELRNVDFKNESQSAAAQINSWLTRQTAGKINGAFKSDPEARLILCNAIYFKGRWLHKFKPADTQPGEFHVTTNQTVTVPMMSQKAKHRMAYAGDNVMLLELPYWADDLSMVIILPRADFDGPPDINQFEDMLDASRLQSWLSQLYAAGPYDTIVRMPRFKTQNTLALDKTLSAMGCASLFTNSADLSGMDGTKYLYIGDAIHTACVEVNESGTEAAAVTLMVAKSKGMTPRFVVDHPFIFLIRDNATGSILFLGRIINPLVE